MQEAQCVEAITSSLSHCLSKWRRLSCQSTAGPHLKQMQLVCSTTVYLAFSLASLLNASYRAVRKETTTL